MMIKNFSIALGAIAAISSQMSLGAISPSNMHDYLCTIHRVSSSLYESGDRHDLDQKAYAGKTFTVSRFTGAMTGVLRSSLVIQPIVIDYGSPDNSFKVVTAMNAQQSLGPGTLLETLTVSEYVDSDKKPFVMASGENVYFGACEHF